jgi:hypothetical protein
VLATVLERQPGARDEVLDGARHEHLPGLRVPGDARADVDREPGELLPDALALSRVDPGPDREAERPDPLADRPSARDRAGGAVEAREEAVPGGVELDAAVARELAPDELVVPLQQLPPRAVAQLGGGARWSRRCR